MELPGMSQNESHPIVRTLNFQTCYVFFENVQMLRRAVKIGYWFRNILPTN